MRDPDSTSYVGTMGDCRASGEQLRAEHLGVLARAFFGDEEFGITQQSMWASELKRSDVQGILAARQALARRWSKAS